MVQSQEVYLNMGSRELNEAMKFERIRYYVGLWRNGITNSSWRTGRTDSSWRNSVTNSGGMRIESVMVC